MLRYPHEIKSDMRAMQPFFLHTGYIGKTKTNLFRNVRDFDACYHEFFRYNHYVSLQI